MGALLIHETTLKNTLATTATSENKRKKTRGTSVSIIDPDVQEDETLQDDELSSSSGVKAKTLRKVSDDNFKVVQFNDNPKRPVCIWVDLPSVVKNRLIECLIANVDHFVGSSDNIPNVDPNVTCHHFKIDPSLTKWLQTQDKGWIMLVEKYCPII